MTVRFVPHSLLVGMSLMFLAAGCNDHVATGPNASYSRAREALPFHLSGIAAFADQQFAPDFGPPNFGKSTFDGRCSVPSDFVVRFEVTGQATYLGNVTGTVEHCAQVDFSTGQTSAITDGIMVYTAANGDVLRGEHERIPGTTPYEQVEWAGGTGRFERASGDGQAVAVCDKSAGTCTLELDGVIAFNRTP